jgi:hypothetical protein
MSDAQLKYLGTGDAATTMGAVEFLAKEVKDGLANLADSVANVAMSMEERG